VVFKGTGFDFSGHDRREMDESFFKPTFDSDCSRDQESSGLVVIDKSEGTVKRHHLPAMPRSIA
jgi:hypothetical protein